MLQDAILQKILNLTPEQIFRSLLLVLFAVGMLSSLIAPFFFHLVENTKAAKKRAKQAVPAQAQARINDLSRRLLEAHERETVLGKENHELRRLVRAEASFGRNHRADIHATIGGRK